jgi:hypothetical protein
MTLKNIVVFIDLFFTMKTNEENFNYWLSRNVDRSLENNVFASDIAINSYNKAIKDILKLIKEHKEVRAVDYGAFNWDFSEIVDAKILKREIDKLIIK